ncbi:hypothetical protein AVEN_146808-1 [Araneus ventricosus]|uniref:Uncharacterized protein n=1 Tax=Araneus ventricosus TaxID=182803 RepID=A0A4Y2T7X4_ARAVE|nr:hypothetical protein AVEN_146808-1 [Araneus ventricosus]
MAFVPTTSRSSTFENATADVDDDILHYIFRCPLLDSQRSLIRPGQFVLQILQDKHRTKEVKSLLSFLFLHQQDIFEQDPDDIS